MSVCLKRKEFGKLITFGPGCELSEGVPTKSYDLSKYIQYKRAYGVNDVSNLRIFGLFGRLNNNDFISSCISKCRDNMPITIWNDKWFDFIYDRDLFGIILNILTRKDYKYMEVDCVYPKKYTLSQIASMIKIITKSNSEIIIEKSGGDSYIGSCSLYESNQNFIGLDAGLIKTVSES